MSGGVIGATVFAFLATGLLVLAFSGWLSARDGYRADSERRQAALGGFMALLCALWAGYFTLRFAGVL